MTPGIIKKLYHTTPVGLTDEDKQEVYPITATSAVYSAPGESSFPNMSLDNILDALNQGYQYMGKATPTTNPGVYNHKVFYLASDPGTYSYFGNIEVSSLTVLKTSGNGWTADVFNITGGGGGGTAAGYIGTTMVQNSPAPQNLGGISQLNLTSGARIYFGETAYIELDQYGFHFSQGIYSDSFVAAGGIGSGGGGGGGSVTIVNDLTTGGTTSALSAEMGKTLKSYIDAGYIFKGFATCDTRPPGPTPYPICYIGVERGYYFDFYGNPYVPLEDGQVVFLSRRANWEQWDITRYTISTGSGGGGGTDLAAVWASLTNSVSDAYANTQINISHIPDITTSKISNLETWISGKGFLTSETDPTVPAWAKAQTPSLYIGTTQVQTSSAAQDLTGILSVKASSANASKFIWDSTNNAWHFLGNLYADGWVSAGGIGSSGQGGGSTVEVDNLLSSGTRIATLTVDGVDYDILAPSNEGTVTGIKVGTTSYSPVSGIVSLPAYPTTLPASDVYSWAKASTKPSYTFGELTSHPTTLSGYGITDAKISNGAITLGSDSITPLVSSDISTLTLNSGTFSSGSWTPTGSGKTFNIPTTTSHLSHNSSTLKAFLDDLPNNYVTLSTTQTITGAKTFSDNPVTIAASSGISVNGSSYIDIGDARIVYDANHNAIHITRKNSGTAIGLYADGALAAGGIGSNGSTSGSVVSIDDLVNTGGLIGTLTIDGYDYAIKNGVLWGTYNASAHTVQVTINGTTRTLCVDGYSSGGGGGSTVSWGTESNNTVPLTVNGTSKTLLLSTALSGYATQTWVQQQNYLTSHQAISTLTLNAGSFTAGTWTPTGNGASFNIPTTLDHISDGTSRKLSDYVTLATAQTITGAKTFTTNPVTIGQTSSLSMHQSSYIDIGPIRIKFENNAIHITKKDPNDNTEYGIYADGFVAAGGVGQTS